MLVGCADAFAGSGPATQPGWTGYSGGTGTLCLLYEQSAASTGSQSYLFSASSAQDAAAFFYIGASSTVPYGFTKPYTVYDGSGNILSTTVFANFGYVTASVVSTTITFTGASIYVSAYRPTVWDSTALAFATVTAQSLSAFTFTSIIGHVYVWETVGE
jgi:hypothetical protein